MSTLKRVHSAFATLSSTVGAMHTSDDRRRHVRFSLEPMYSRVIVRRVDAPADPIDGHAYDISAGGIRFELDSPIETGERVLMRIDLPQTSTERSTQRRSVYAFANVVWLEDEAIGPHKMAAVFTEFARPTDGQTLLNRLQSGRYSIAA